MEQLSELSTIIQGFVTTIILPLLGIFLFYDSKKRKADAEARKADAEARKEEEGNITSYAAEWKELYEKKEAKVIEQDAKIDQLYIEKNEDRKRIRDLMKKNTSLEIENIKLQSRRCDIQKCDKRQPPSDY